MAEERLITPQKIAGDEELYREEIGKICVASREKNVPLE